MRSHSVFIFTFAVLSGLVLALPSTSHFDRRSDYTEQRSSDYIDQHSSALLPARSNLAPVSKNRRRGLFSKGVKTRPGVKCDSTFYKQTKVETTAAKVCQREEAKEKASKSNGSSRGIFSKLFVPFPRAYSGAPDLFPGQTDLRMVRITRGFFAAYQVKSYLNIGKKDYVVFGRDCRPAGIVRQETSGSLVRCFDVQGNFPAPMRPPGAEETIPYTNLNPGINGGQPNFPSPSRPPGLVNPDSNLAIVPVSYIKP